MNIITADFNWISLLIIVIAIVIGRMKAKSKQTIEKPVFFPSEYDLEEEEKYTVPEFSAGGETSSVESDSTLQSEPTVELSKPVVECRSVKNTPIFHASEEKEEEAVHFDLRQAIISSEILRRPDF